METSWPKICCRIFRLIKTKFNEGKEKSSIENQWETDGVKHYHNTAINPSRPGVHAS